MRLPARCPMSAHRERRDEEAGGVLGAALGPGRPSPPARHRWQQLHAAPQPSRGLPRRLHHLQLRVAVPDSVQSEAKTLGLQHLRLRLCRRCWRLGTTTGERSGTAQRPRPSQEQSHGFAPRGGRPRGRGAAQHVHRGDQQVGSAPTARPAAPGPRCGRALPPPPPPSAAAPPPFPLPLLLTDPTAAGCVLRWASSP